jgi:hypothetical protein
MLKLFKLFALIFLPSLLAYGEPVNVLFIGNSYTYVNNLPDLFRQLAASGGKSVHTDSYAPGGYSFENHLHDSLCLAKINLGIWNYVVLQEQSQIPVIDYLRYHSMYPSGRSLDSIIKSHNASTIFYMTWGRRYGGQQCIDTSCSPVFTDFFHMQDSLKSAYCGLAQILNSSVAPVGEAFRRAKQLNCDIDLWENDNSHPSLNGSYLAACIFYAKIFGQSPVGLDYTAGLSAEDALFLQTAAAQTPLIAGDNGTVNASDFYLYQNYPNPFNSGTIIRFALNRRSHLRIFLYDIQGRLIRDILNDDFPDGIHTINFNASDLSSGVYFFRLQAGENFLTKKFVIVK